RFGLLGLLAAFVLSSCAGTGAPQSTAPQAPERVLRAVTVNMPRSLDPTNIEAQRIINNGFAETLLLPLNDGSVRPWLARSWKNLDPLTWQVELQPNVKFWSGAPMDAAAVKASMLRFVELSPTAKARLGDDAIEVKDPLTLEFRTKQPNPVFIYTFTAFPIHNAAEADKRGDSFASDPDLTGFMLVDKYVPGELVVAKPNPNYWGKKAQIDRFEIRQAADPQARLLALRSGDADIDYNVEIDDHAQAKTLTNVDLYSYGLITRNVWFNIARVPAFADPTVRKAMSLAVDRQQLLQSIYQGTGQPPTGHFPPGLPYSLDSGGDSFDLSRAQKLLDEAGYPPGSDGIRQKDGKRMSYGILT
ncbi:MAG: ABC transporter substrate-binding protein, partial [Chloroflexota bacterium]